MKKYNMYLILLLTTSSFFHSCGKQQVPLPRKLHDKGPVQISGCTEGREARIDSVRFYFGGELPGDMRETAQRFSIITDQEGKFNFRSPGIEKPERVIINIYGQKKGQPFFTQLNNYLVEPGDSIYLTAREKDKKLSFVFSGKGAAKFRCRKETIDQHGFFANRPYISDERTKYKNVLEEYERMVEIADSLTMVQIAALDKYKNDITPEIYQIMKADIIGHINFWLKILWKPSEKNEIQVLLSRRMVEESKKVDLDENIMAMSPRYIKYLTNIAMAELIYENPGQKEFEFFNVNLKRFDDLCAKFRKNYTGLLREKLLLHNLLNLSVQDTEGFDDCLKKSYDLIQTPVLKEIMDKWYGRKVKGAEAYDFALPDTRGHMVNLKDFGGKVVYIDIWFTGCGGCIGLARKVDKMVYPKFKDNPEVVFVSISLDKDRERWLKSVEGEKYGLKEYVNLYTDGMGLDHPFMEYYGVRGGPTTMLIDKEGKIYSAAPPKHNDDENMSGLISLIEEALKH